MNLEEMTSWDVEEVAAQVKLLLSPSQELAYGLDTDSVWFAQINSVDPGKDSVVLWEDQGLDLRNVLFNAYGWIYTKNALASNPNWIRRKELTRTEVSARASKLPDPDDLDETYLTSVYDKPDTK